MATIVTNDGMMGGTRMDPKLNDTRGLTMKTTRLAFAAIATMGMAGPLAAEGKANQPEQYISQSGSYGTSGMSTAQSHTYGTSGSSVGTVTAPSVGSYYWPSVGVTNAVPTWSNTTTPDRR
jgi:hypothetical protein